MDVYCCLHLFGADGDAVANLLELIVTINSNLKSGGLNPNTHNVCSDCTWFEKADGRTGGWCGNPANRVAPQKGWPNGFARSVSINGGCDLHTNANASK